MLIAIATLSLIATDDDDDDDAMVLRLSMSCSSGPDERVLDISSA